MVAVVQALAWPGTILGVCILFRKQVATLIGTMRSVEVAGAKAEFAEQLDKLEEVSWSSAVPSPTVTQGGKEFAKVDEQIVIPELDDPVLPARQPRMSSLEWRETRLADDKRFEALVAVSPQAAIIDSWRAVETVVDNLCSIENFSYQDTMSGSFVRKINSLLAAQAISPTQFDTLLSLSELRNSAARSSGLSHSDAYCFKNLSRDILEELQYYVARFLDAKRSS